MRHLQLLAQLSAALAGVLLIGVATITCASLIGRNTLGLTLAGDFELTGLVAGAAVALFLPLCQLERSHIIVDFFTAKASERTTGWLDRAGALVFAVLMAALAWRTAQGGISSYRSMSGTMILNAPEWVTYACMVPPMVLSCLIAAAQAAGWESGRPNP